MPDDAKPKSFSEDDSKNPPPSGWLDRLTRRFSRPAYAVVVLGIYAMPKLQIEAIPEVDLPSLTIATQWTGASPKAYRKAG